MMLYPRQRYLKRLRPFYDDAGLIKVITGIRRCGKSSLMMSVADELLQRGVDERSIVFLNLDSRELRKVTTPDALDRAIEERIPDSGLVYLFIDEVQNVKGFETVINAYREDGRFSIFITGSNSYLLSGELATKLTGRYIELEMYTLSYGEYLDMRKFIGMPVESGLPSFNDYLTYGGFPKSLEYSDPDAKALYIQDVARQIFEKDITDHSRVTNRDTFERVQSYLINNYASPTNLTRIAQYLQHSEHIAVKRETLARYVRMLENAKILYTCPRFDLRSRKSLRGRRKILYCRSRHLLRAQHRHGAELRAGARERAVSASAGERLSGQHGANRRARMRFHRPQTKPIRIYPGFHEHPRSTGGGTRIPAVCNDPRRLPAIPVHARSASPATRWREAYQPHAIPCRRRGHPIRLIPNNTSFRGALLMKRATLPPESRGIRHHIGCATNPLPLITTSARTTTRGLHDACSQKFDP